MLPTLPYPKELLFCFLRCYIWLERAEYWRRKSRWSLGALCVGRSIRCLPVGPVTCSKQSGGRGMYRVAMGIESP
jgi:hypothetical protein